MAHQEAAELLDPALSGHQMPGTWDPCAGAWHGPPSRGPARPHLSPRPEGIVVGDLQNVASDIRPIRVQTLQVPVANRSDSRAIIHRVEAGSSGHGPLTARVPRSIEAGTSSILELTLAAPVDQAITPGDRFDIALDYHGDAGEESHLSFTIRYDGGRWRAEGKTGRDPP